MTNASALSIIQTQPNALYPITSQSKYHEKNMVSTKMKYCDARTIANLVRSMRSVFGIEDEMHNEDDRVDETR